MRKVLFIAGVILILLLSGCETSKEHKQEAQAAEPVTLTVFTKYNKYDSFIKAIEEYNQSQEKIKVVLLETEQMEYHQQLNLLFTSGQMPDIFTIESDWISGYRYNNWLKNLTPYEELLGLKEYPEWAVEYIKSRYTEDSLYAVPLSMATYRLVWNKSIFKKAGLNPDLPPEGLKDMADMSAAISRKFSGKGVFGMILPMKQGTDCFEKILEQPSTYSSHYYYDPEKGKYNFLSYREWFETVKRMEEEGGLMQGSENMDMETALNQFCQGTAGMMYLTSDEYRMFCNNKPRELLAGIAMPPVYGDVEAGSGQNISLELCYGVYKKSRKSGEAMEVLKMLTSHEVLQDSLSDRLFLPVKSTKEDQELYFNEFAPGGEDIPGKIIFPPNSLDWKRTESYAQVLSDMANMETLLSEESMVLNKSPNAFKQ